MHTVWKGAISFGLVHVPVKMFTATEDKDIRFRSLHKDCGMSISYVKTCKHCNKEVTPEDVVRGFEYEKDKYVMIKDEEIEAIRPEATRAIQIIDFVDLSEIDPIYFEKTYYLSPDMAGAGAYTLLLEAIKQTGKIGIAKVAIRNKSSLAAIRVVDRCLCMETMHYPDEIRAIDQVPNLPEQTPVNDRELSLAKMLVEQLSAPFEAAKYTDDYRIALMDAIQQKIAGDGVDIVAAPATQRTNVIDLMAALQASLDAAKSTAGPNKGGKPTQPKAGETVSS